MGEELLVNVHCEDPQTEGAEEEVASMACAASISAAAIFSSAVFSLVVDVGGDVDADGGIVDVGCVEEALPRDRVGHVAPTVFRRAVDALM